MESLLNLTVAGGAPVRILQITDTHLFAEKHETLLGVNTWESYQAVLSAIHAEHRDCDLIVATGDLAQDQSSAAYQHFAEGIASFSVPCPGCRETTISSPRCTARSRTQGFLRRSVFLRVKIGKSCCWTARYLASRTVRAERVSTRLAGDQTGCRT